METRTSLVTASTLLANALIDHLTERGESVRVLVPKRPSPYYAEQVAGCETFFSDRRFSTGVDRAMEGVDTLYHLTVVLGGWQRDCQRQVIEPTVERTRRVMEAAARHGVRRVVLCGTYFTTDYTGRPRLDPESWNPAPFDYYDEARTRAEREAWDLADRHGIEMISLLASRMIGPYSYPGRLTASVAFLESVLWNRPFPVDYNFWFNFVDARGVAAATAAAAVRGDSGRRYLLVNERFLSMGELFALAKEHNPRARDPWKPGKGALRILAGASELVGWATNREPFLFRGMIDPLWGHHPEADCGPARRDLGFEPGDALELVQSTYAFLADRQAARAASSRPKEKAA